MRRTSSWRSIRLHQGQNWRCTNVIENSKVRMSRYLDTSAKALMAQIMVQYGRFGCSSSTQFVRSSFGRTIVEKAIRESSFKPCMVGKKFQIGNAFFLTEKKDFLYVYVDDIKLAGKRQNINPTWKVLMKDVDLGEPTSFLDHVYLGCTQRECQISKDIVDNYRSMFESRMSPWAKEKLPETNKKSHGETWCRNDIFMVQWCGRSIKEMCGKILRICK